LGYINGSPYFKHNDTNFIDYDVVIVDEASMIDVPLFYKLISAIDPKKRVVFLGDKNQLSSVEAGSLLGDLCNSQSLLNLKSNVNWEFLNSLITNCKAKLAVNYKSEDKKGLLFEHITELKKNHRFNSKSDIGRLSKSILSNNKEELESLMKPNNNGEVQFDSGYSTKLFEKFIASYEDYAAEPDIKKQ
jgi:exodeoxyribonuclease V alpha subunit